MSTPVVGDVASSCHDLLELLIAVSDGRSAQGRDHPVAVVLTLVAAATVAGATGYTAIAGWVADVPAEIMDSLHERVAARPAGPPSRSTIWRVCADADADVLDAVIAEWTTTRHAHVRAGAPTQLRLDGKTVGGAVDDDGNQLHLLSALAGDPRPGTVGRLPDLPGHRRWLQRHLVRRHHGQPRRVRGHHRPVLIIRRRERRHHVQTNGDAVLITEGAAGRGPVRRGC
ncbi:MULTISPECIES: transposase family protein [unclassified Micromonospora]|uniref:transposase family protein n=1 Tax=unclassified Micromonospora TaxID=2617518 RepID=UPI003A8A50D3